MKYYIKEEYLSDITKNNAGSKARQDIEKILIDSGFKAIGVRKIKKDRENIFDKLKRERDQKIEWEKKLKNLTKGDVLLIQMPIIQNSVLLNGVLKKIRNKRINIVILIHDLNSARFINDEYSLSRMTRKKVLIEEKILNIANYVISHNEYMTKLIVSKGINPDKIVNLNAFDYLLDSSASEIPNGTGRKKDSPVVIAGNLTKEGEYLYKLPKNVKFNLYGNGYEGNAENADYKGSFPPETIPNILDGGFGLVWDGPSPYTCESYSGNYLRLNNPHKVSLYLVSALPVIIWKEAAMAKFVLDNGCGMVVDSLSEIQDIVTEISKDYYEEMVANCVKVSKKLQSGYYTKKALERVDNEIQRSLS